MKMKNINLRIESDIECLKIQIKKDSEFNFFHIFLLIIMTIGYVIVGLFIFNSVRNDGVFVIKIAFIIFGLVGLWTVNRIFRQVLVFVKGNEEIKIDNEFIHYSGEYGPFKKSLMIKLNQINKLDLTPKGTDKFSQSSNIFTQVKYGMIIIENYKRKKIGFGQSLEKQELENLYAAIEKKIRK